VLAMTEETRERGTQGTGNRPTPALTPVDEHLAQVTGEEENEGFLRRSP